MHSDAIPRFVAKGQIRLRIPLLLFLGVVRVSIEQKMMIPGGIFPIPNKVIPNDELRGLNYSSNIL